MAKYWPRGGRLTRRTSSLQGSIDELVGSGIADRALRASVQAPVRLGVRWFTGVSYPASSTAATATVKPSSSTEVADVPRVKTPCSTYAVPARRSTRIGAVTGLTIQYSGLPARASSRRFHPRSRYGSSGLTTSRTRSAPVQYRLRRRGALADNSHSKSGSRYRSLHRVVEREQFRRTRLRDKRRLVERYCAGAAATLGTCVTTGVLDEDLAHEPCGDAEEVGLILQAHLVLIHQPRYAS